MSSPIVVQSSSILSRHILSCPILSMLQSCLTQCGYILSTTIQAGLDLSPVEYIPYANTTQCKQLMHKILQYNTMKSRSIQSTHIKSSIIWSYLEYYRSFIISDLDKTLLLLPEHKKMDQLGTLQ